MPEFFEDGGEKENRRQIRSTADAMRTTSAATVLLLCLVVLLFQLAVAWDDFDDKFRLDKKVVDDSNIFGSDFEWWKRQEDIKIKRSDKVEHLPYPLIDFDSSKIKQCFLQMSTQYTLLFILLCARFCSFSSDQYKDLLE